MSGGTLQSLLAEVRRISPITLAPRRGHAGEVIAPMAPAPFINPAVIHRTAAVSDVEAGRAPAPFRYREGIVIGSDRAVTLPLRCGVAAAAMMLLTRVGTDTSYAGHVLPAIVLAGVGMGLIFAPAMATATGGVRPEDAGVASAMVNTSQQVGGSIGTALLSTFSATAAAGYVTAHGGPSRGVPGAAAVHGYTTAFWWSAGIFLLGAVLSSVLLRSGAQEVAPGTEPVLAH